MTGDDAPTSVEELSVSTCWALLREVPVGRIALRGDVDVEVFPVNFIVDHGTVVFRTSVGTKLSLLDSADRGTFEADAIDAQQGLVWSVVVKGGTEIVRHHDAMVDMFEMDLPTWQRGPKPSFVRLTPDLVTGRRFIVTEG